ncbi:WXG100 family type VII secretion target [Curtobacterium citreum]|uniref:WXG100 family type VII secretion target n=1 Tax=Curtobacterium citreum TaxID=2036 RepID=UPI0034D52993
MGRPSGWDVVDQGDDPVKGDPSTLRMMAREYQRISDAADDASTRLKSVKGSGWLTDWEGEAADVFVDAIEDTPSDLTKLVDSYELAATALSGWADTVDDTQYRADGALADAKDATGDLAAAQDRLADAQSTLSHYESTSKDLSKVADEYPAGSDVPDGVDVPSPAQLRAASDNASVAQGSVSSAQGDISAAQSRIDAAKRLVADAKGDWQDAEQRTATKIGEAADAGLGKQSTWDKIFGSEAWETIVSVAKVVVAVGGIIAMIIPGPWTLVIAAIALVVLADTLYKMSKGEADGWDLAFSLLDCVPAGGAVAAALKGTRAATAIAKSTNAIGSLGAVRVVRSLAGGAARATSSAASRAAYRFGQKVDGIALAAKRSDRVQDAYIAARSTIHRLRGGQFTDQGNIIIHRWTPVERGPLSGEVADTAHTFRSGTYNEVLVTNRESTLYRSVNGDSKYPIGEFWGKTEPSGPFATQQEFALRPEWHADPTTPGVNTPLPQADQYLQADMPVGTRVYEGPAAPQSSMSWSPDTDSTLYGNAFQQTPGGKEQVYLPRNAFGDQAAAAERLGLPWNDALNRPATLPVVRD